MIRITKEPISLEETTKQLALDKSCGAFLWFAGVVRNHHLGRQVANIDYECYEEMAVQELQRIHIEAKKQWPIHEVILIHRIGNVDAGETSLIVGVNSPHRHECFEAMHYIIDELKKRVPIWKKEYHASH
ncbi:MAG: hypothetical protein A3I05_02265 [Deltaproteobacteria bacterium RIFCSPLOWO2_02_FULL_44_10]|nr:MAG: hypothetical protein A3C46_08430 [Deltaproteobacteria bacterium RIFCSPHIGHO2_02_FULL_44_16]OGQ47600.1 MAG: hypothetical protein A3I05_02265 [Deltaproteobacteria bacterium RIFCSPLOWO2_02_FULL_44_10]